MVVNAWVNDHNTNNFSTVNPAILFSRYGRCWREHKAERMLVVHREAVFSIA